jgi:hypothetical protein
MQRSLLLKSYTGRHNLGIGQMGSLISDTVIILILLQAALDNYCPLLYKEAVCLWWSHEKKNKLTAFCRGQTPREWEEGAQPYFISSLLQIH